MNTVILYAHPNPLSFNAALAKVIDEEAGKRGWPVKLKDLYAMDWNPVLSDQDFQGYHTGQITEDIKTEQGDISWADLVVMVAPVWWHSVPAILKGYMDRVFSLGFAYKYGDKGPEGLLKGKTGLLVTTCGASREMAEKSGMLRTLETSLVNALFGFSGFQSYQLCCLYSVPTISDDERKAMLSDVRKLIAGLPDK